MFTSKIGSWAIIRVMILSSIFMVSIVTYSVAMAYHFAMFELTVNDIYVETGSNIYTNYGLNSWTYGGIACYWVDPNLQADFNTALSSWTSAVPQFRWAPYYDSSCGGRIDIYVQHVPMGFGIDGAADPSSYNYLMVGRRVASWLVSINADLSNSGQWAPGARQATIAHELGHVLGLGEQYWRNHQNSHDLTCSMKQTLMDANWPINGLMMPCSQYGYGPQFQDVNNVYLFHPTGSIGNLMVTPRYPDPYKVRINYNDYDWDEMVHILDVWWTSDGSTWWLQHIFLDDYVGVAIEWRTNATALPGWPFQYDFDRRAWGTPGGPGTQYEVCGYTWHAEFGYTNNYVCQSTATFWLDY